MIRSPPFWNLHEATECPGMVLDAHFRGLCSLCPAMIGRFLLTKKAGAIGSAAPMGLDLLCRLSTTGNPYSNHLPETQASGSYSITPLPYVLAAFIPFWPDGRNRGRAVRARPTGEKWSHVKTYSIVDDDPTRRSPVAAVVEKSGFSVLAGWRPVIRPSALATGPDAAASMFIVA